MGDIFVGTHEEGIYLSEDDGNTWTEIDDSSSGYNGEWGCSDFAIYQNVIFAKNITGVFLSTNSGVIWTSINEGLPKWNNDDRYLINSIISDFRHRLFD